MAFPERVVVIGGGRWARELLKCLIEIAEPGTHLLCCTRSNETGMRRWIGDSGLSDRVSVLPLAEMLSLPGAFPTIVANAARDHAVVAEAALQAGLPVLVEKPLATSAEAAQHLVDVAAARPAKLAVAHVFSFARYVQRLEEGARSCGGIRSIDIRWTDPPAEVRYGESKRYDAALPVFADVLAHVISIVDVLLPGADYGFNAVTALSGGRIVNLKLHAGSVRLGVELARDSGACRQRVVDVTGSSGRITLDFSEGAGQLRRGDLVSVGDPDWGHRPGPLATMLRSYLDWCSDGCVERRFDPILGLATCRLIDQITAPYREQRLEWLVNFNLGSSTEGEAAVAYALREILAAEGVAGAVPVSQVLSRNWWALSCRERQEIILSRVDRGVGAGNRRPAP